MKILWITNLFFPEYYENKGQKAPVVGGWMKSLADKLRKLYPDLELAVASRDSGEKDLTETRIDGITFYAIPGKIGSDKYDASIERYWKRIHDSFQPDVTHIHGSEFSHGLAYVNACTGKRTIVSIQGIVSRIARHNSGGISNSDFRRNITFRDFVRRSTPKSDTRHFRKLGKIEEELLRKVDHIVGRTEWDKAHTWAINPQATYHFCNETLRPEFYYGEKWHAAKCRPHRIFLSQAATPLKGLHKVIEALPYILREYPDSQVYVAGANFTRHSDLASWLRYRTYAKYINRILGSKRVADHIHFLGFLNAEQMAEQLRLANVFICPSSIENSPNSLGEAQLIGTPVVASYVGGIPDMVKAGETGLLYRFEETEMMAFDVCRIFADTSMATTLSRQEIEAALLRHDGNVNAQRMMEIYQTVAKS